MMRAMRQVLRRRAAGQARGRQRVFFAIILPLALLTFWLLWTVPPSAGS